MRAVPGKKSTTIAADSLLGSQVEIASVAGIRYRGIVRSIRDAGDLGELFELGSDQDGSYQRLVYVVDRRVQVELLDDVP